MKKENVSVTYNTPSPALPGILSLEGRGRRVVSFAPLREKVGGARMRGNLHGFTLIELLVVVLIIGILAAVAVPQYKKAVMKSRFVEYNTITHSLAKDMELYYTATGSYPEYWNQLNITIPNCSGEAKLGDLICPNFYIDLHDAGFILRDEPNSPNRTRTSVHLIISYRFLHTDDTFKGLYNCVGTSVIGKNVCKSICRSENCFYK